MCDLSVCRGYEPIAAHVHHPGIPQTDPYTATLGMRIYSGGVESGLLRVELWKSAAFWEAPQAGANRGSWLP